MATEFRVPEVSEGVKKVDLAALKVSVGDVITANTIVAEVETDKAAAEIECPHAGRVAQILAKPGDSIEVGAVLLVIEAASGAPAASVSTPTVPAPVEPVPTKPVAKAVEPTVATPAITATSSAATTTSDNSIPAPAGPATRRLARELGVDLHQVKGSGTHGRITQDDVKNHVKSLLQTGTGASSKGGYATPPLPDFSKWGTSRREPLSKIGKAAAANLSMCWNVIPHVTQHDLIDITELEAARKRHTEVAQKTGEAKITMTAIAMKAVAICLQEYPKFNASLDPQTNELVIKEYYHLGCAVDTPNGLLVPVIRDVNRKSISQIAGDLAAAAAKARDKKLTLDEMQGATFTITNLGGIGGTAFTPIVNYPEVAILGMSRGRTELRLDAGAVVERLLLPLSLSYDHRVINGADAARFVVRLGQLMSDPFVLAAYAA